MLITILNVLLGFAMVAVLLVLATGVISFGVGGEFNRKYANKLMQLRVATQAFAVAMLLLRVLAQSWAAPN